MTAQQHGPAHGQNTAPARPSNLRTALVLGLIAAVFFAGVIVNRYLIG